MPKIDQRHGISPWARLRRPSRPRSRSRAGASAGRGHPTCEILPTRSRSWAGCCGSQWASGESRVEQWSLTTLREKLVKIGARIVRHGRYLVFQLAEVAVPRTLFAEILRRIDRLRGPPVAVA